MACPVSFPGVNRRLGPPHGDDDVKVQPMDAFGNGVCSVSLWQLTPEELDEVKRTGCIYLTVFGGASQPPVFVGGEEQTRNLIADYGVWKR